jgi:mycothiol system anti-sigma-R factor
MSVSCEQVLQGIWDYLDGETDGLRQSDIKQHLDLCRSCFSRIEFERALRQHIRQVTNCSCPEGLKDRIRKIVELF